MGSGHWQSLGSVRAEGISGTGKAKGPESTLHGSLDKSRTQLMRLGTCSCIDADLAVVALLLHAASTNQVSECLWPAGAQQASASASPDMASTGDGTPRAAAAQAAPTASMSSSSQQVTSAAQKPPAALDGGSPVTPAGGSGAAESLRPALTKRGSGKKGIVSPKPTPKPASPSTPQPATPPEGVAGDPSDSAASKAAEGPTSTASSSAASQAAVSAKLALDTIEPGAGELAAVQTAQASGKPTPAGSRLHGDGRPVEGSPAGEARAAGDWFMLNSSAALDSLLLSPCGFERPAYQARTRRLQ